MRVVIAFLVFISCPAFACLNTYEEEIMMMMHKSDPQERAEAIRKLEMEGKQHPSVENRNDLAVAYIIDGRYAEAAGILRAIEKEHPGLSRTASNLGTALELSGEYPEALRWIRQGITRNPGDHEGTEWLHAKILEAKIAIAKDPKWLDTHSVLGTDFGTEDRPHTPAALPADHLGKAISLEDAEKAMNYQLAERLKFVTSPDPVVASLYRSRADIAYLLGSFAAPDYYEAAKFFGMIDPLIERRIRQFKTDHKDDPVDPAGSQQTGRGNEASLRWWAAGTIVVTSLLAVGWFGLRRQGSLRNNG
jgi:tetratricopeptide (TPR) repeat protein